MSLVRLSGMPPLPGRLASCVSFIFAAGHSASSVMTLDQSRLRVAAATS